jgi:hypothetical protein
MVLSIVLVLALALPAAPGYGQAGGTPARPCTAKNDAFGVTIGTCRIALNSSPAGTPDYYMDITIEYTAPQPGGAVQFRCDFSSGGTHHSLVGVLRQSPGTLHFVSPFTPLSSSIDAACTVTATSAHPP